MLSNRLKPYGVVKMLRKSTRSFWQTGRRIAEYSFFDLLHGYIYLRWPYAYIGIAKGDRRVPVVLKPFMGAIAWLFLRSAVHLDRVEGKREFADRYHAKVVPTEAAVQLVTLEQPIELRDLEKIIPYSMPRTFCCPIPTTSWHWSALAGQALIILVCRSMSA